MRKMNWEQFHWKEDFLLQQCAYFIIWTVIIEDNYNFSGDQLIAQDVQILLKY